MSFGGSRARYHFCSLIWTTCQKYRGASREFDQVMIHPSFYLTMARIWCRRSSRRQPPSPRYKFLGLSIFFSSGSLDSSRGKWSTSSLILAVPLYLMLLSTSCLRSSGRCGNERYGRPARYLVARAKPCLLWKKGKNAKQCKRLRTSEIKHRAVTKFAE